MLSKITVLGFWALLISAWTLASPARADEMTNSLGMKFVSIPAGTFMMGANPDDSDSFDDERPRREVTITRAFYLGKYEVTQAQWKTVMGDNPSGYLGNENPVETVSWLDIQNFLKKLNQLEKKDHYRLPTEAEWEYAARAGSDSIYYFGDDEGDLTEYAWYETNLSNSTSKVGLKKPNAWGLYDMIGNVWEWAEDWYDKDYYANGPSKDPQGATQGDERVNRGGSRGAIARYCRSSARDQDPPSYRDKALGFRVAFTAEASVGDTKRVRVTPSKNVK
ncbi:MAG: formylglycine-generating enzyme family protein [Deltaproteobacteria bacterium]|jgi:formylglycine-generating enzyme required for sulfatase activity|nr:formylglycine-generating enzyme family protein [Deltaproteobacteria bacterium]